MVKVGAVVAVAFLFTACSWGQLLSGNAFIGYSYTQTNLTPAQSTNLNGWNGSVELKVLPLLGVVADVSGHYGSQDTEVLGIGGDANLSEYNYLFGPQLSFKLGKFRPFVHALFGGAHIGETLSTASNSSNSFADALGGGIDYHLFPLISWRFQLDALQTRFFGTTQNNPRFSTGIVVHF
jgi:hypothetical protein